MEKQNNRTLLITFIFVVYLISTFFSLLGIFPFVIGLTPENTIYLFNFVSLFTLLNIVMLVSLLVLSIIYLPKLWRMSPDLKKWTDTAHLAIMMLLLLTLIAHKHYDSLLPYAIFSVVFIALWFIIRNHLSHLEREGKAKFTPGLFNKNNKIVVKA